jgi:hypothetical protein
VQVSWSEVQAAIAYRLSYRVRGGNFVSLPLTSANYAEIRDAQEGEYEFSLRAIGITRKESVPATFNATVLGKTLPPSDVTGFLVQRRMSDLLLQWDELLDADLSGYEVRVGPGWDNAQLVAKTAATQMVHDQSAAGQYPYHIRGIDTSGNYSAHVTTFVLTLLAPSTVRQFDVVQSANRLEFRWQPNPEPEVVGYELREGAAWDASLFVAEVKSTSYTLPSGFDGERRFWIKAIASPGIYSDTPTFVSTVVAQPQNANLILERDEQASGFPGTKHFASVVAVNGRNVLRMSTGAQTAEYLFELDLVSPIRAQNTLLNSLGASVDDRTTWLEANFPWSGDAARRQWAYDGAVANVDARFQIAREDTLQAGEIYGWRLNGSTAGLGSAVSSQAAGIAYAAGRYGDGLMVKDTTRVAWTVSVPSVFHTSFWFIPVEVTTCVIWTASGPSGLLLVGYDAATSAFFLEDHLARRVSVPFGMTATDRVCIGVCQTASERRLFAGRMGGDIQAASAGFAPVGILSTLRLY